MLEKFRQAGEVVGRWSLVSGMTVVVVHLRNMVASGWAILIKFEE